MINQLLAPRQSCILSSQNGPQCGSSEMTVKVAATHELRLFSLRRAIQGITIPPLLAPRQTRR